jgi:hypothetical protein
MLFSLTPHTMLRIVFVAVDRTHEQRSVTHSHDAQGLILTADVARYLRSLLRCLLGPLGRVNSPIVTSRSSKSRNSPCTNETNPFDIKKIYVGESAGSMILSPTIEYVKDMDDSTKALELKDSSALSIVKFYPLPHHTNFPFKKSCGKNYCKI